MDLNSQEVHLSHYWNIIIKRWKIAVSILAVVMIGTFLASYFSKPLYQSRIQIQIERDNQNQLTIDDLFGIAASDQEFLQTQYVLLKSRGLAQRVIDDNKLLYDAEFYPPGVTGKKPEDLASIRDAMVPAINGGTTVIPVHNTSLVEIYYVTTSPRLAQKIAEGIGDSYMAMNKEQKFEAIRDAGEFLQKQIAQLRLDIDSLRDQMKKIGDKSGFISPEDAAGMATTGINRGTNDVQNARAVRIEKQTVYDQIAASRPELVAASDPLVLQLTQDLSNQTRDYENKRSVYLEGHPQMLALKSAIEKTQQSRNRAVQQAFERKRDEARRELNAAVQAELQLSASLASQRRESISTSVTTAGMADLNRTMITKQSLLEQLEKKQNETEVTARSKGLGTSNIRWVDHAPLPSTRFNLSMKHNLQNAFPLGVVLGLAAIFFLEYMDRSVKTPEELERVTKFASLGIIPSAASVAKSAYGYGYGYGTGSAGPRGTANLRPVEPPPGDPQRGIDLLPHLDSRSPIAEAYRAFRTSLLLASANSPKVIVITSTFAREGKTTTSVNLAVVLAQMGKPVLLIDADLRRPRLQKVFNGKMNLGLVNYLAANIPLEDVVQESGVPHLSVVLSGPTPPNPSELLASDRMKNLIHDVRSKFAYVIFDSPPVMAVTDSIVLAVNADGVVLCVHGGHTPREIVQRAAERLRQSNIPVLGALLNNLDLQQYGYSFKKSYYDYYDSEQDKEKDKDAAAQQQRVS
jgi:capsular exopolysaccharide synthesis family protein